MMAFSWHCQIFSCYLSTPLSYPTTLGHLFTKIQYYLKLLSQMQLKNLFFTQSSHELGSSLFACQRDWRSESSPEDARSPLSLQSQEELSNNRACVSLHSCPFLESSVDYNYSVPQRQASKHWSSQALEIRVFQRVCRVSTPYCFLVSEYNNGVTSSSDHHGMPHQPLAGKLSLPGRSSS